MYTSNRSSTVFYPWRMHTWFFVNAFPLSGELHSVTKSRETTVSVCGRSERNWYGCVVRLYHLTIPEIFLVGGEFHVSSAIPWVEFSSFSNPIVPNILLTDISVQDSELWLNLLLLLTVTFMSPEMYFFCLVLHVLDLLLVNQKMSSCPEACISFV